MAKMKLQKRIPTNIEFVQENGKQVCHILSAGGTVMKIIRDIKLADHYKSYKLK